MKTTELQINDWVMYRGKPRRITGLDESSVYFEKYCTECHKAISVTPVPLTPEIFEKNGWRYNDAPFVQGWEQYGITIINNRITCGQNVSMKVEFVHELQHALKLCNIEKEIIV